MGLCGKFTAQPHTTLYVQFLDRENKDKNNRLPLGKQICFTIVWGCAEILPFCGLPLFHKALLKQGLFVLNTISTNSYRAAMDLGNLNPCRPCFEDLANKFGFESQSYSYSFEVCSHLCRVTSITCVKYWQIENIDEKHTPQFLDYNSDFQYSCC